MEPLTIVIIVATVVIGIILLLSIIALVVYCKKRRHEKVVLLDHYIEKGLRGKKKERPIEQKRNEALLNCRFFLKDSNYEFYQSLFTATKKTEKKFFFVIKEKKRPLILSMTEKDVYCKLQLTQNRKRGGVRELLEEIKHPYILPTIKCDFLSGKDVIICIRPYNSKGSLKDLIYNAKPTEEYQYRYSRGKRLPTNKVQIYGRQILEALSYLQLIEIPFLHLHTGNLIVVKDICYLTDFENVIMGTKPHYRHIYSRLEKKGFANRDKYWREMISFGCTLFEMAVGTEFTQIRDLTRIPANVSEDIVNILNLIFDCENKITLEDIITHPFFDIELPVNNDDNDGNCEISPDAQDIIDILKSNKKQRRRTRNKKIKKSNNNNENYGSNSYTSSYNSSYNSSYSSSYASSSSSSSSSSLRKKASSNNGPPPPGPPPPGPPPPGNKPPPSSSERSALLTSIRKGKELQKAETNDRSQPII